MIPASFDCRSGQALAGIAFVIISPTGLAASQSLLRQA